jgi:hypothetical protein
METFNVCRTLLLATFVATAMFVVGCDKSPTDARVTGTVTLDGQPLPGADVEFYPEEGRASVGTTDEQGVYTLMYTMDAKGAELGNHTVQITTAIYESDEQGAAKLPELVPRKYKKEGALTATVEPGANEIDFELTSE